MRKFLTVSLAVFMISSMMNVVSFADNIPEEDIGAAIDETGYIINPNDNDDEKDTLFVYYHNDIGNDDFVRFGETIYFPILNEIAVHDGVDTIMNESRAADYMLTEYDSIRGTSIRSRWSEGKEYVESITIIKDKATHIRSGSGTDSIDGSTNLNDGEKYFYFLAITFANIKSDYSVDVSGEITLRKSGGDYEFASSDSAIELDVDFELGYMQVDGGDYTVGTDYTRMEFSGDEEYIEFSADPYSYFIVDTRGQDEILARANKTYDDTLTAKFPSANFEFFNGYGMQFNQVGEMNLYSEEDGFVYEQVDGMLKEIDAYYDEYEQVFRFRTRNVGKYVISDEQLRIISDVTYPTISPAPSKPPLPANATTTTVNGGTITIIPPQ